MNITPYLAASNMAGLKQSADIIDETNAAEGVVYFGFCKPGTTGTDSATWAICKLVTEGEIVSFLWADGNASFTHTFDSRADYNYKFSNFRAV